MSELKFFTKWKEKRLFKKYKEKLKVELRERAKKFCQTLPTIEFYDWISGEVVSEYIKISIKGSE